jgi:hypothetical protein
MNNYIQQLRHLSTNIFNSNRLTDTQVFEHIVDVLDIENITPSETLDQFAELLEKISTENFDYICEILALYIQAAVIRKDTSFELIINLSNYDDCQYALQCFNIFRKLLDNNDDINFNTLINYLLLNI